MGCQGDSPVAGAESWLVIDTDCGIDDAVALCMALRLGAECGIQCRLVTTVHGNCSLTDVNRNVARCVHSCGLGSLSCPKIVAGAARPVSGQEPINSVYFHGHDGLGDAGLPEATIGLSPGSASEEIVALCKQAAEAGVPVTLVALGPLTNVALALRLEPGLPSAIKRLVFMGGCSNGRGNKTRVAEFNVMGDPEAAAEVFAAEWPRLEVVSWELCSAVHVPWPTFDRLLKIGEASAPRTDVAEFLAAVLHKSFVERRVYSHGHQHLPEVSKATPDNCCWWALLRRALALQTPRVGGAIICDAVAMAIALRPAMARQVASVHVEVELEGQITRGQTVVDFGHSFDGVERKKGVRWIVEADVDVYIDLLKRTVQGTSV